MASSPITSWKINGETMETMTEFAFFFLIFILFLNFTILYWFCQISKLICHRYTCVPHPEPSCLLPPHTIPLGRPSAPAPSIQYHESNLDWRLISLLGALKSLLMVTVAMKLRVLLLGRKAMTKLDSILKSRDITLPTKECLVKTMVFPVVMYGCESWTIKKVEH